MQTLKPILSVFLLLTYFVGIGHEFLPHSHADEVGSHQAKVEHGVDHGHHHSHHHHDDGDHEDHSHVVHQDHFDDGLLDLLICILSETDHTDADEHYVLPSEANQTRSKGFEKAKFVAVLVSFVSFIEASEKGELKPDFCKVELASVQISTSPLRGPPSIS